MQDQDVHSDNEDVFAASFVLPQSLKPHAIVTPKPPTVDQQLISPKKVVQPKKKVFLDNEMDELFPIFSGVNSLSLAQRKPHGPVVIVSSQSVALQEPPLPN